MKQRNLKPLWITLIVLFSLVLIAVVLGVLNSLVGKGQWRIGWQDYTYDDAAAYQIGGGTVYEESITELDISWVSGNVEVVLTEDDRYLSLSEEAAEPLDVSAELRWRVRDGELEVKWRKSGWYLSSGAPDKKLILRVPAKMAASLSELSVEAVSASVQVKSLSAVQLELTSVSGSISVVGGVYSEIELENVSGGCYLDGVECKTLAMETVSGKTELQLPSVPDVIDLRSVSGDLTVTLPQDAAFTLEREKVSGQLTSDFTLTQKGESHYVCGEGTARIKLSTVSGDLRLKKAS